MPVVTGLENLPTELPTIAAPTPGTTQNIQVGTLEGINIFLPPVPTVIPTKSIKLPAPETLLPAGKVGPGGLPIKTDLATLNQLRREVDTAVNINPMAAFQKKIAAPTITLPALTFVNLPTIAALGTPALTGLPTVNLPVAGLPTELPTVNLPVAGLPTVNLPTIGQTRVGLPTIGQTKPATPQPIIIPKIKGTAATIPDIPRIQLPMMSTVMKPIPLTSPAPVTQKVEAGLAVAYTPEQQVVKNITSIDPSRLKSDRAKKDDNSYSVVDLRAIAGSLNLAKAGNKKDLVDRIKAEILKRDPNAFN